MLKIKGKAKRLDIAFGQILSGNDLFLDAAFIFFSPHLTCFP